MKWLLYLTIIGILVSGINSRRFIRQEPETDIEATEAPEVEATEAPEVEETEAPEAPEVEEAEPTEPAELEEPAEIEESESVGVPSSSVVDPNAANPDEQAVARSSVLVDGGRGGGGGGEEEEEEGDSSSEEGARGAAINQNSDLAGGELAGGESSQEAVGGVDGGAGLGGVPMDSEEDNTIGGAGGAGVRTGTQLLPTEFRSNTVGYVSTVNPVMETTGVRFDNRGDAFMADFGPQEGAKNELGSGPEDDESSTSSQKIGLIVGATTAGTVAVVAGLAIAYVKLKGAAAAGAA